MVVWYIVDHFGLEATALIVRPLERGVAPRGVPAWSNRGMGLISPSLNSSAAVVQVRCLILIALGRIRRSEPGSNPDGVWWSVYSHRGTDDEQGVETAECLQ